MGGGGCVGVYMLFVSSVLEYIVVDHVQLTSSK